MNTVDKVPFDIDLFMSGDYRVITRNNREIDDLIRTDEGVYCLETNCLGYFMCWDIRGRWRVGEMNDEDLFLIPIGDHPRPPYVRNLILSELERQTVKILKNEFPDTIEAFLTNIKSKLYGND